MHQKQVVHHDLHPIDVLQTLDGTGWRLADFGNAIEIFEKDGSPTQLEMLMYASCLCCCDKLLLSVIRQPI